MMELEKTNELFPVVLINPFHYPIRVLTWMDEDTGESTFAVIKQFGKLPVNINRLTYEHLRLDPKVQVISEIEKK